MATEIVEEARTAAAIAVGERLARLYGDIAERSMRDLPVSNPKLRVEAVGFHDDGVRVVGIVVTPWFMNVVIAASPLGPAPVAAPPGSTATHDLPSGTYDFVVGEIADFGRLDSLSLFSPMFEFDDPEVARATAEAAMAELRRAPEPQPPAPKEKPVLDRRALLFGRPARDEAPGP
ncbi:MAG: [NiFe]-hydrogenase assembly chaperone HybE [Siculibacillus sp.]|nr:[NiFe]-hydrogenase assembly chaperone HybE [Siculibacillus sp.]